MFLFFVLFIKFNVNTSFCKIYQQYILLQKSESASYLSFPETFKVSRSSIWLYQEFLKKYIHVIQIFRQNILQTYKEKGTVLFPLSYGAFDLTLH